MEKSKSLTKLSRFLSLVLRHKPETIGLKLSSDGWAKTSELLKLMNQHGKAINHRQLVEIVATNNKKRFAFNDDESMIRANQGHSIEVDLGFTAVPPPEVLFHGTAERFLGSIYASGLTKRSRLHVHMNANEQTAISVGKRHGKVVVLRVLAKEMKRDGYEFFLSENQVWLTDHVPPSYLQQ